MPSPGSPSRRTSRRATGRRVPRALPGTRPATVGALGDLLPGATWTTPGGGFYVWLTLPDGVDASAMLPRALDAGVAYVPDAAFFADGRGTRNLRLSYCYPEPERIREGVRQLGAVVEAELDERPCLDLTVSR